MHRLLIATVLLLSVATSGADVVTTGTIYWMDGPTQVGEEAGYDTTATTVDHYYFTVNTPGTIAIDIMSYEVDWEGDGYAIDLNNDGEIACIDPFIYLFEYDGDLTEDDLIAANDDSTDDGYAPDLYDNSVDSFDSYIQSDLGVGTYVLAVGDYSLSIANALVDYNPYSYGPYTAATGEYEPLEYVHDHGDYQITLVGDVTLVPEPASLALLVLASATLRRR